MGRRVQLFRAPDVESAWQGVIRPWVAAAGLAPWRSDRPPIVAVPTFGLSRSIRERLVSDGVACIGLRILTQGDLWRTLVRALGGDASRVAAREDLHLLLAAAAEQFADVPAAQSVAQDPGPLMRTLDLLAAAGAPCDVLSANALGPVIAQFRRHLATAGLVPAQDVDRELLRLSSAGKPVLGRLLIAGFDGRHWPLWTPLRAAAHAAADTTVCLLEPRESEGPDALWLSSWEEHFGEATYSAPVRPSTPFASLAEHIATLSGSVPCGAAFRVGGNAAQEAQAIVVQSLAFLARAECTRLGIVFPGPGPLARGVAALLGRQGIPHCDGLGRTAAREPADAPWMAWLQFQADPRASTLLPLVKTCPAAAAALRMTPDGAERELRRAFDALAVEDLSVLGRFSRCDLGAESLCLPRRATFAALAARCVRQLGAMPELDPTGERRGTVEARSSALSRDARTQLSRDAFVRWLRELTVRPSNDRSRLGANPYARLSLTTYDDAVWQGWSHLILTGLNRDNWPPPVRRGDPYLSAEGAARWNRDAVGESRHGSGQRTAVADRGYLVTPADEPGMVRQQFLHLVDAPSHGLCFTASLTRPDAPGQPWSASDLLVRAHAAAFGAGVSDDRLLELQQATSDWVRPALETLDKAVRCPADAGGDLREDAAPVPVEQTAIAYRARRDGDKPFGCYELALDHPPPAPVILPCSEWERALSLPEVSWLRHFLGVQDTRWNTAELAAARTMGTWVHGWLRAALGADVSAAHPAPLPADGAIRAGLLEASRRTMDRAAAAFAVTELTLPHWWRSLHAQAYAMAFSLAESLCALLAEGWNHGVAEWPLPRDAAARIPGNSAIPVTGRIDLLLARSPTGPYRLLDFKTGDAPPIGAASLARGEGVQVLLYALALEDPASADITLAVARPGEPIGPGKGLPDLLADPGVAGVLVAIARMQRTGRFGLKANPRNEFASLPAFPLAWLPVGMDVLDRKNELESALP